MVPKGTKTMYIFYATMAQYANPWALARSLRGCPRNSAMKSALISAHYAIQKGRAGI